MTEADGPSLPPDSATAPPDELHAARDLEAFEELLRAGKHGEPTASLRPDALRAVQLMQQVFGNDLPVPPSSPQRVARFHILSLLGVGRFGVVWRAFDPECRRQVAVKVLQPSLVFDKSQRRRFQRECELAAKLDHRGIVPVYETGSIDELLYMVMPVCQGITLDRWLAAQTSPVPVTIAVLIARQLAEATHYGHIQGVVHRDLKPGNVMMGSISAASADLAGDEQPRMADLESVKDIRILDFGLAIPMEVSLRDTRGSVMAGTPLYMAPEQAACRLDVVGPATDVFAIGAILYELLTGEPPFAAASLPKVLERLENEVPTPIRRRRPDVPRDLEAVCLKCLAYDVRDRYADASALANDLDRVLGECPVSAHSPSLFHRLARRAGQKQGRQMLSQSGVALNLLMLIWAVSALLVGLWQSRGADEVVRSLMPMVLPMLTGIAPLHLTLIWLSRQIALRPASRVACLLGLVLSLLTLGYGIAVLLGATPPTPAYSENKLARIGSFTLVVISSSLTSAIFLLAAVSVRPRDGSTATSAVVPMLPPWRFRNR